MPSIRLSAPQRPPRPSSDGSSSSTGRRMTRAASSAQSGVSTLSSLHPTTSGHASTSVQAPLSEGSGAIFPPETNTKPTGQNQALLQSRTRDGTRSAGTSTAGSVAGSVRDGAGGKTGRRNGKGTGSGSGTVRPDPKRKRRKVQEDWPAETVGSTDPRAAERHVEDKGDPSGMSGESSAVGTAVADESDHHVLDLRNSLQPLASSALEVGAPSAGEQTSHIMPNPHDSSQFDDPPPTPHPNVTALPVAPVTRDLSLFNPLMALAHDDEGADEDEWEDIEDDDYNPMEAGSMSPSPSLPPGQRKRQRTAAAHGVSRVAAAIDTNGPGGSTRLNGASTGSTGSANLLDMLDSQDSPARPTARPATHQTEPMRIIRRAPFPMARLASSESGSSLSSLSTLSGASSSFRPLARVLATEHRDQARLPLAGDINTSTSAEPTTAGRHTEERSVNDSYPDAGTGAIGEQDEEANKRYTAAEKGKGRANFVPGGEEPIVVGGSSSEEDADAEAEADRDSAVRREDNAELEITGSNIVVDTMRPREGEVDDVTVTGMRRREGPHMAEVERGENEEEEWDEDNLLSAYNCPICFCQPERAVLTDCGHIMCGKCLLDSLLAAIRRNPYAHPSASVNSTSPRGRGSRGGRSRGRGAGRGGTSGTVPHSASSFAFPSPIDPPDSNVTAGMPGSFPNTRLPASVAPTTRPIMPPPPPAYPEQWTIPLLQQAYHHLLSSTYDYHLQQAGMGRENWAACRESDDSAPPAEGKWEEIKVKEVGRGLWELEGYEFMSLSSEGGGGKTDGAGRGGRVGREARGRGLRGSGNAMSVAGVLGAGSGRVAGTGGRRWVVEGDCPVCRKQIPGGFGPEGLGGVKGLKVMLAGI